MYSSIAGAGGHVDGTPIFGVRALSWSYHNSRGFLAQVLCTSSSPVFKMSLSHCLAARYSSQDAPYDHGNPGLGQSRSRIHVRLL